MDPVIIARWEFALTAGVHFLMVATTLGLAPLVAALQTRLWWATRRGGATGPAGEGSAATHRAVLDRVLRLYLINYGIGIVTGLVMEMQMALNWTGGGSALYDPVAAMLGVETLAAFFVESTLLGLFLASRNILGDGIRAAFLWGVAATAWLSAWVVVAANAFLHHPVGVAERAGRYVFTDPWAVLTQPGTVAVWWHILGAAGLVAAFWLAAAGARILLRTGPDDPAGNRLLRLGVWIGVVAAPLTIGAGITQFSVVRPDPASTAQGLHGVLLALMMLIGMLILLATWFVLVPLLLTGVLPRARPALWVMGRAVWIPLAVCIMGWVYREEARQPWFILGRVRVQDAISAPAGVALPLTAIGFVVVGTGAAVLAWTLMNREIDRPARYSADLPEAGSGTLGMGVAR